jgi:hypothetical protein
MELMFASKYVYVSVYLRVENVPYVLDNFYVCVCMSSSSCHRFYVNEDVFCMTLCVNMWKECSWVILEIKRDWYIFGNYLSSWCLKRSCPMFHKIYYIITLH